MADFDSRIQRIHTFNGHLARVNAVKISPKSGQIVISGGDDRKAQVWRLGQNDPIMTLAGHPSAIESLAIDYPEELVVTGCSTGTIKLWDLEQNKAIRTLSGHKAGIPAIDFHPFGDFFASGSADTTVKIWDVRRKSCIQTYIGQQDTITALKITPDGRWIATADSGGQIKIWDMTAGKLIKSFAPTSGGSREFNGISSLAFNPAEFVMAASNFAGKITFYDLQTFQELSSSSIDSSITVVSSSDQPFALNNGFTSTNYIEYDSDGYCVFQAAALGLDVWAADNLDAQTDHADVRFGEVSDLRMHEDSGQILLASRDQHIVYMHNVPVNLFEPFASYNEDGDVTNQHTSFSTRSEETAPNVGAATSENSAGLVHNEPNVFQSPQTPQRQKDNAGTSFYTPQTNVKAAPKQQEAREDFYKSDNFNNAAKGFHSAQTATNAAKQPKSDFSGKQSSAFSFAPVSAGSGLATNDVPLNFDVHSVLQASHSTSNILSHLAKLTLNAAECKSEDDVINAVASNHRSFTAMMGNRLALLRQIRQDWKSLGVFLSSVSSAVSSATGLPLSSAKAGATSDLFVRMRKFIEVLSRHYEQYGDSTVTVEVLRILNLRPRLLGLDSAGALLELCAQTISGNVLEDHISIVKQLSLLLVKNFGDVVASNMQHAATGLSGVNMSQEERVAKCQSFLKGHSSLTRSIKANISSLNSTKTSHRQQKLLQEFLDQIEMF